MGNKSDFGGVSIAVIRDLFSFAQYLIVLSLILLKLLMVLYHVTCGTNTSGCLNHKKLRQKRKATFPKIPNHLRGGLHTKRICSGQTESEALNHITHLFM